MPERASLCNGEPASTTRGKDAGASGIAQAIAAAFEEARSPRQAEDHSQKVMQKYAGRRNFSSCMDEIPMNSTICVGEYLHITDGLLSDRFQNAENHGSRRN